MTIGAAQRPDRGRAKHDVTKHLGERAAHQVEIPWAAGDQHPGTRTTAASGLVPMWHVSMKLIVDFHSSFQNLIFVVWK